MPRRKRSVLARIANLHPYAHKKIQSRAQQQHISVSSSPSPAPEVASPQLFRGAVSRTQTQARDVAYIEISDTDTDDAVGDASLQHNIYLPKADRHPLQTRLMDAQRNLSEDAKRHRRGAVPKGMGSYPGTKINGIRSQRSVSRDKAAGSNKKGTSRANAVPNALDGLTEKRIMLTHFFASNVQ